MFVRSDICPTAAHGIKSWFLTAIYLLSRSQCFNMVLLVGVAFVLGPTYCSIGARVQQRKSFEVDFPVVETPYLQCSPYIYTLTRQMILDLM